VRRVHVADLEAGALAGQTARPERRQATLVRDLGQRVGLVHELRQLRAAEELLDHRRDRLGVDQVVRHQRLDLLDMLMRSLIARSMRTRPMRYWFSISSPTARTRRLPRWSMSSIDAAAVAQLDQVADRLEDVALGEHGGLDRASSILNL
jgi:hypothetical protein